MTQEHSPRSSCYQIDSFNLRQKCQERTIIWTFWKVILINRGNVLWIALVSLLILVAFPSPWKTEVPFSSAIMTPFSLSWFSSIMWTSLQYQSRQMSFWCCQHRPAGYLKSNSGFFIGFNHLFTQIVSQSYIPPFWR